MTDKLSEMIYEHAGNLHESGLLSQKTMQEFKALYLMPSNTETSSKMQESKNDEIDIMAK